MNLLLPRKSSFRRALQTLGLIALSAATAQSQTNFVDDFESGTLANWTVANTAMYLTTTNNKVPTGGTYGVKGTNASDKIAANLTTPITQSSFKMTYWLYDSAATRAYGEVRQYTGGSFNNGTLVQLLAAGKYNSLSPGPYFVGETWDGTKYQGRVANGAAFGWFNLSNPGAPSRAAGWHKFDIERGTNVDGTININFYVDNVLGRQLTNTYAAWSTQVWNCVALGFGTASTSNGDEFYDGVVVVSGQPWFAQQPLPATNNVGDNVTLTAVVDGLAGTTYQWRRNGNAVPGGTSPVLNLNNAQATNSGLYTLVASNLAGTATSVAVYVQVNPLNLITVPPTNLVVNVGESATFYAEGVNVAHPASTLYYQWNKNGQPISGATGIGSSTTFTIPSTTTNDAGNYTVTLTNSVGDPPTTSSVATLTINTAPSFPAISSQTGTLSNAFNFVVPVTDDLDVQSQPFQTFETNAVGAKVTFGDSHVSGTTGNRVDTSGRTYVTNVFPAGHVSSQVLHVSWNWTNNTDTQPWLRLTTANSGGQISPNPAIYAYTPLRFDVWVDKDIRVAVGHRESNPTVAIGANAGSSSAQIELVGVDGPSDPPSDNVVVTAGAWTTVNLATNLGVAKFPGSGNGILESTTGKTTLEDFALEPGDLLTIGQYTMYIDNLVSVPANALQFTLDSGPSGATIDQYTGRINWVPEALGSYGFTVRATDTRGLFATTTFNVQVNQAVNPPGAITISQSGASVTLNWSGSFPLQSSSNVNGPYLDVSPAVTTGPYTIPATNSALFFRLRN